MAEELKIAIWNVNGLHRRTQELKIFLQTNEIDVILISEIHFIKIPHYTIYDTKHPSGKGHGGSAVII